MVIHLLRIVVGVIFFYHGYLKLFVPGGFSGFVKMLEGLGVPFPIISALLVSVVEFVGGFFFIVGMFTRWSAIFLTIDMLVALFLVHIKNGLNVYKGGFEFVLALIAGLFVIWVCGPGKLSFGKLFKSKHLR